MSEVQQPDGEPDAKPKSSKLSMAAWVIPTILVLYVLSIGPVMYTADSAGMSPLEQNKILSTVYWPIGWLEDHVKLFGDFINWWLTLWGLF